MFLLPIQLLQMPCHALQTKRGTPAKATTSVEFLEVFERLVKKAIKVAQSQRHLLQNPRVWQPLFCFDRARIHDLEGVEKVLAKHGLPPQCMVDLPHYAYDFQKPIEHVHGTCKRWFRKALHTTGVNMDEQSYHSLYEQAFMQLNVDSIRKDIESLPAMYQHILAPLSQGGSEGGYARKPYN
jgi:hypothetical protein